VAATAKNASAPSSGSSLYSIAGKVVNAASGEPIRHANVAALSEEDSHTVAAVESDVALSIAVLRLANRAQDGRARVDTAVGAVEVP